MTLNWNRNVLDATGRSIETEQRSTLSGRLLLMANVLSALLAPIVWYQQTIGPSRAEGTSTRQIGSTKQLTQV